MALYAVSHIGTDLGWPNCLFLRSLTSSLAREGVAALRGCSRPEFISLQPYKSPPAREGVAVPKGFPQTLYGAGVNPNIWSKPTRWVHHDVHTSDTRDPGKKNTAMFAVHPLIKLAYGPFCVIDPIDSDECIRTRQTHPWMAQQHQARLNRVQRPCVQRSTSIQCPIRGFCWCVFITPRISVVPRGFISRMVGHDPEPWSSQNGTLNQTHGQNGNHVSWKY